jgi:AcrR family transcriptional regulator
MEFLQMSSADTEDGEKARSQRRRGAVLEQALLDAAWEELKEVGYYNLTFDSVAARAGTSKAVLYRRWANRLELAQATMRAHRPLISGATPDTGSLRGDVIAQLEGMMIGLNDLQPDIVWGMLMDAINDDAHRAYIRETLANDSQRTFLLRRVRETNVAAMTAVLKQAEARGEVTVDAIPVRVITLPFDIARHELLLTGRPLTHEAIIEVVDDIILPLLKRYKPQ